LKRFETRSGLIRPCRVGATHSYPHILRYVESTLEGASRRANGLMYGQSSIDGLLGAGLTTPPSARPKVSMRLTRQWEIDAPLGVVTSHLGSGSASDPVRERTRTPIGAQPRAIVRSIENPSSFASFASCASGEANPGEPTTLRPSRIERESRRPVANYELIRTKCAQAQQTRAASFASFASSQYADWSGRASLGARSNAQRSRSHGLTRL
jgi:hypothetical protein